MSKGAKQLLRDFRPQVTVRVTTISETTVGGSNAHWSYQDSQCIGKAVTEGFHASSNRVEEISKSIH